MKKLGLGVLLVWVNLFVFAQSKAVHSPDKPNILFIFTDDQMYNAVHALGNSQIITPNMDELIASGTVFSQAFNMGAWHGAVCVASRLMLMTGMSVWDAYAHETVVDSLVTEEVLWPQLLRNAGYDTYMTGKWHVNTDVKRVFDTLGVVRPGGMPPTKPSSYLRPVKGEEDEWRADDVSLGGYWQEDGRHWSEVQAEDAIHFIEEADKKENPFFIYLAFNAPHDPRQSPKEYLDMYDPDSIRLPGNFQEDYPYREAIGLGLDLRDEKLAPLPRTPYAVRKHMQEYYALVTHVDAQIGKVISALKASDKYENTLIVFTADHGLAVGAHGFMGKQNMYDHSMRVPLVLAGPGVPKGSQRSQLVYLQDVMPTTLELAGVQIPEHVYYHSLLPQIKNRNTEGNYQGIYGGYMDLQRMLRTDEYKLIIYPTIKKVRLFDLKKDPYEIQDLAEDPEYQEVLKDLKNRLIMQQKYLGDEWVLDF